MADNDPYGLKAKFEALKNRKRYDELSAALLLSLDAGAADLAVDDFVTAKVGPRVDLNLDGFSRLSPGLRMYFSTYVLDMEMQNGGFHQFFWNSSKAFAEDAASGFQLLGEFELATLTDQAAVLASGRSQRKWSNPIKVLQAFSRSALEGKFNDLDRRYYVLAKDLPQRRLAYVRAHPEEFDTAKN